MTELQQKALKEQKIESKVIQDNKKRYWLKGWSDGYLTINPQGHVLIKPGPNKSTFNLYKNIKILEKKGISPPVLFCFDDIIRNRIKRIYHAFEKAFKKYCYDGSYQLAYPVKVNQQKYVINTIKTSADAVSLEVGSKPELVAVLGMKNTNIPLLLCNGYKDADYIELALLSKKIGYRPIIIIEQIYELDLVLKLAEKLSIKAEIGLRMNPNSQGSGKWASSAGEAAKFGLSSNEIITALDILVERGKSSWLKLLHMHIGSQLTSILSFKKAISEASRSFVEIAKEFPSLSFFDVGGGLGVDYEGSRTTSDCSMDYTVEQYAEEIVYTIGSICQQEGIPCPKIISESGRAVVAHHAVLITEVIDVGETSKINGNQKIALPPSDQQLLNDLYEISNTLSEENCIEAIHDCYAIKNDSIERFIQGSLSIRERAYAEQVSCYIIGRAIELTKKLDFAPHEISKLQETQHDMYFCNLSVFRSIPDTWAIQQLFPILPIHRLNQTPTKKGIISDVTCDSDGIIDSFVGDQKISPWLPMHEYDGNPYYIGIFLVGAYQEILGSYHNLFGRTNVVNVGSNKDEKTSMYQVIDGDQIRDVLEVVRYDVDALSQNINKSISDALKNKQLTTAEATRLKSRFKQALESYTYLVA